MRWEVEASGTALGEIQRLGLHEPLGSDSAEATGCEHHVLGIVCGGVRFGETFCAMGDSTLVVLVPEVEAEGAATSSLLYQ